MGKLRGNWCNGFWLHDIMVAACFNSEMDRTGPKYQWARVGLEFKWLKWAGRVEKCTGQTGPGRVIHTHTF